MNEPITRENYREYDAINYSKLSSLVDHPREVNLDKDFSDGMRNGDILDLFMFDGEDAVVEKYYISSREGDPSDTIKEILEKAPNYSDEMLLQVASEVGYGNSWNPDTVLRKIHEGGQKGASYGTEYIKELEDSKDKIIITLEEYTKLQRAAKMLKNHQHTSWLFTDIWDFQYPICQEIDISDSFEYEPVLFKALLDGYSQHEDYNVIADLKYTSRSINAFKGQFWSWKYYLQAALYSDLSTAENGRPTKCYYVIYSSLDDDVAVFQITDDMLSFGRNGGYNMKGNWVKGYKELAKELLWHQENNLWDYPYDVYMNNGIRKIDYNYR